VINYFQQQYHVTKIETGNQELPLLDFSQPGAAYFELPGAFSCQMFVHNIRLARLVAVRSDNLLAGVYTPNRIWPVRLPLKVKRINYVILAWPHLNGGQTECFHQEFTHRCYGVVMLHPNGELRSDDGPLFKRQSLNQLLDSDRFPRVQGIQFVA